MRSTKHIVIWLTVAMLMIFSVGMLINLDNIAFWEDEGETVQLGKSILKFGYPSVFDGRSFILLDDNFDPKTYLRYTSPYLQFYVAAFGWLLTGGIGDMALLRLPFALIAVIGVWVAFFIFRKLKFSSFSLFLYSLLLSSSVQTYLYWRQARHYALQFPLAVGLLISYLSLHKKLGVILFLLFGFLFYHAYYPGFVAFYISIIIHAVIRKITDSSYRFKPLVWCTVILIAMNAPAFAYLHHYRQLPRGGFFNVFPSYLMDLNYFAFTKITGIAILFLVLYSKRSFSKLFWSWFQTYRYSLSLFTLPVIILPILASFGVHVSRYLSVLFPFSFLILGVSWTNLAELLTKKLHLPFGLIQLLTLPLLAGFVNLSHPKFFSQLSEFTTELRSTYIGPVDGVVNTINGISDHRPINPSTTKQPDLLLATNFEDGAIYAYLDNQFLNILAPEPFRTGTRLPDWIIIRRDWGQEEYLMSFLRRGKYRRVETQYCDLTYQNTYLVRSHRFRTVTDCPDGKLTLYRLTDLGK